MEQEPLFFDSIDDAIGNAVQALGGFKAVSHDLWPAMKMESAYAKLKSALDPAKERENLDQHEIEFIAERASAIGNYAIPRWFAEKCCGEFKAVAPVELEADLDRRYEARMKDILQITERMERLRQRKR